MGITENKKKKLKLAAKELVAIDQEAAQRHDDEKQARIQRAASVAPASF